MICSSGIGFDPVVEGTRLTFGFDGIWQGTAVLYDHQSDSLWMHLTGKCFEGPRAGTQLRRLSTGRHTTWEDWTTLHPGTDVLVREARYVDKPGDRGYFDREGAASGQDFFPPSFLPTIEEHEDRFAPHDLVYGVVVNGKAHAYRFKDLARTPVVEERLGAMDVTVWFDRRTRSAAAFDRRHAGKALRFERHRGGLWRDAQTKSLWTMEGRCVGGPLKGAQLVPVWGLMSEWYGWRAHHPETTVWAP